MAAKIRRRDMVQVQTGKDRGRRGEVRQVLHGSQRVIVTGANMVKKHRRSRSPTAPSEILEVEAPLHVSNVALVCGGCDEPTRVGFRVLGDGRKVRYCKACDEAID
ncbi:MAG: 50S ribosomal protein L24 [Chloroflexi bacterium]|nr:50S ribosomal protein L24 [Chloroflexota bacterium]MYE47771.1 50S ribosomal protein L24 [Chloroflexota bacterium]